MENYYKLTNQSGDIIIDSMYKDSLKDYISKHKLKGWKSDFPF